MNAVEIIKKKRDGLQLSAGEIQFIVQGYTSGDIPDYQASAFLMAAFLNGLNTEETAHLTSAMLNSGSKLDLSRIDGVKVDKHSTGGVGDKTSLILAPIAAAAGVKVPMISGRGLGHTGGTLDKLESIPGFRTDIPVERAIEILQKTGAVLIGQTKEIAPADKLFYALRDVTATVESIPLITASIMSKKLAEDISGLVMDVKTGSGAFMKNFQDASRLAESLALTANKLGVDVHCFITNMDRPLGDYVGNWLEVVESIKILRGELKNDLSELSLSLAASMIELAGIASSGAESIKIAERTIADGSAFEKFIEIAALQGAETEFLRQPERYPKAAASVICDSPEEGFISDMDTYGIGMAALHAGAGRLKKEDSIDPSAGIIFYKKTGQFIRKGEQICEVFSGSMQLAEKAAVMIIESISFSASDPEPGDIILSRKFYPAVK